MVENIRIMFSQAVERYLDMVGVTGSIPVPPTIYSYQVIKYLVYRDYHAISVACGLVKISICAKEGMARELSRSVRAKSLTAQFLVHAMMHKHR